jgi:ABC-type amino acid transport substrate-binding protein
VNKSSIHNLGKQGKLLILFLLAAAVFSRAQDSMLTVQVATFSPFVFEEDSQLTGFDIELWEAIAKNKNLPYKYEKAGSFQGMLDKLESCRAHIGFSGVTITRQREEVLDFSHSYFNSGLSIMSRSSADQSLLEFLKIAFSPGIRKILLGMLIFVLICAHLIWFFERGRDAIKDRYFPGIFEGAWWAIVTMSTVGYGDISPKRWTGRITAVFVIITGIAFFGIVIAELSSTFALRNIQKSIETINDLKGKAVATVQGTTSQEALEKRGFSPVLTEDFEKSCQMLINNKVEAVVFDTPVLKHFLKNQKHSGFRITGEFEPQEYGIMLCSGSPWRETINQGLLAVQESGEYATIYRKWFDSRD